MTESHQEQEKYPLLCDEYSDEELRIQDTGPKFHRRFRHSVSTGRARTHALGAAAIITNWPDDISSLLQYWWIFLGMFTFMVFLIYNSFLAIAVIPKPYSPFNTSSSNYTTKNKANENHSTPNIYMHIFVANYEEFKSNDYIPTIQTLAKKYTNFKYNLFIVLNDSTKDIINDNISDEQINELALNSLWDDDKIISRDQIYEKIIVKQISLSEYMDKSPLQKYWRLVPYRFIGFLARCIAVWDKGGVAFNPLVLTPKFSSSVSLEKLYSILGNFNSKNKTMTTQKRKISKKTRKKLNNIRDIINYLESDENMNESFLTDSLAVAENIPSIEVTSFKGKRDENLISLDQPNSSQLIETHNDDLLDETNSNNKENEIKDRKFMTPIKADNSIKDSSITAVQKLLPKFLEFFFQLNSKNVTSVPHNINNTRDFKFSKNPQLNDTLNNKMTSTIGPSVNKITVKTKAESTHTTTSRKESTKLIIDLKGNFIATEIACHAFIGTVLSNISHSTDYESLTDFIINELSLFCKGSLSTCNNVEVLLL